MNQEKSDQETDLKCNSSEASEQEVLTSLVCDTCFGDNLYKCIGIRPCLRCKHSFCLHFASKVDPCHFCVNCFSDLQVTVSEPEVQVIEHYNAATNETIRFERHPRGRRIKLDGDGYLFALRMYQDMNDAEHDMFAEYHRAMLGFIVNERETKKAEKAHKAASVKLGAIATPSPVPVAKTTVTSTTKTVVSKQNKAREQAKAALFAMYKGKLSMEQIDQMLNAQP